MKASSAWLLTEGAQGMISQVQGLAQGLGVDFEHKTIHLKFPFIFIPPKLSPIQKYSFNFNDVVQKVDPNNCPDFLISCGRKSVVANIFLKNFLQDQFKKKITNIHIQDPKINPSYFDFLILPSHDNQIASNNVIYSTGALHYIKESEIAQIKSTCVSVILGGPNKYYNFEFEPIKKELDTLFENNPGIEKIQIIASRRTPKKLFEGLKSNYSNNKVFIFDDSLNRKNYVHHLSNCSHIMVTCDSISMISEAAITAKPIYILYLKKKKSDYRFRRFFQLFEQLGIIKRLNGKLEHWTYEKLYETKRIALIIKNKI